MKKTSKMFCTCSLVGKSTICAKPYSSMKSIKILHKKEGFEDKLQYFQLIDIGN